MNKKGLLCLDWDGTLVDSSKGIVVCVLETLTFMKVSAPPTETILGMIGKSEAFISQYYFGDNKEMAHRFWFHFRSLYQRLPLPPLLPGVLEFLNKHREDYYITIVTNKPNKMFEKELYYHNLADFIDYTYTADRYIAKPDPAMILQALEDTGISPSSTWMIGDSEADAAAAKNAGVHFLAVHAEHWHIASNTMLNLTV